jgi:RHS repeat-associated protein
VRNTIVRILNCKKRNRTKTTDNLNNAKNKEYEFDALGRLTKAKGGVQSTNFSWQQTYSYDRFGNRTNVVATGNGIDGQPMQKDGIGNLTYDNLTNRITNSGYQFDVAGNQTRSLAEDGVTWLRYEYDAANRLQVIRKDSDNSVLEAFQFGSTNQRLMKTDYALGQTTIYSGDVEYTEYVSAIMTWTKSYVRLGDSILSTITKNGNSETTEFNHPDRLGTRIVTNQTAGTSTEQASLPFGTALGSETSRSESKRFTSYDRSVRTGLDYAINRTYDSKLGRFTQVDPIKMASVRLAHPQTLNLYSYCGNDPINHTDPDGLFWGSLFKFLNKAFKWIAIAVTVAVLILSHFYAPGTQGVWAKILGFLIKLNNFVGIGKLGFSSYGLIDSISIGYGAFISAGLASVGAISNNFADKKNRRVKKAKCISLQTLVNRYLQTLAELLAQDSGHRTETPLENGFWIYARKDGSTVTRNVPFENRSKKNTDFANPPKVKGARLIAIAHTHPYENGIQESTNSEGFRGNGPSNGDINLANKAVNLLNGNGLPDLVAFEDNPKGVNNSKLKPNEIWVTVKGVGRNGNCGGGE